MSNYVSEFALFTEVRDTTPVGSEWSSIQNILNDNPLDFYAAETWNQNGKLELTLPKINFPGGIPLVPEITITRMNLQVRWGRGGNTSSGGWVFLNGFSIGGNPEPNIEFVNTSPLTNNIDEAGGNLAFWNVTQQEMQDFLNGDTRMALDIDTSSINGSTETRVHWVKVQVEYDYTGGGKGFPRLF